MISNADPKRLLGMLDAGGSNGAVPDAFRDRLDAWKVRSPVVKVNAALTELPHWTAAGGETWPAAGTVNCRASLDDAQAAFEALGPRRALDRLHRDLLADGRRSDRRSARPPRHLRLLPVRTG